MFDSVYPVNMIYSTTYPLPQISRSPAFTHYPQMNARYDSRVVRSHDGSSGFFITLSLASVTFPFELKICR